MKRGLAAAGVAAVLLLTGCSAATQEDVAVSSATSASAAPAETSAPLTAEAPAPKQSKAPDEAAFVAEVRDTLRDENVIPNATDPQLVEAGRKACEMAAQGTPAEDISVIEGEERGVSGYYLDSFKIYSAAVQELC